MKNVSRKMLAAALAVGLMGVGGFAGNSVQAAAAPFTVPQTNHEVQYYGAKDLRELAGRSQKSEPCRPSQALTPTTWEPSASAAVAAIR